MSTESTTTEVVDTILEKMTYGFYLLAARKDGADLKTREKDWVSAGTVSWVMQTSFSPLQITVALQKNSDLHETVERAQAFTLTILGEGDEQLVEKFANNSKVDYSEEKVNGVCYSESESGAPILDCGIANLECKVVDALTTNGDHILFVADIVSVANRNDNRPLCDNLDTDYAYGGTN